jgi:glycogen operon protein
LGITFDGAAANVAVYAGRATRVELCVFDDHGVEHRMDLPEQSGGVWHGAFPDLAPGIHYGFRVHGERRDGRDMWNPAKLLLDPYARAITGELSYHDALYDNDLDSADSVPRSVFCGGLPFDWEDDRPPATPLHETVIYEAHVDALTRLHPGVVEEQRGTYLGIASPAVIDHLRSLGVTALELLPVHRFVTEPDVARRGLENYWGYNSIGFFAPHHAYAAGRDGLAAVDEFKTMVRSLHRAGIEVILDVVYNHTAEGGFGGPILAFRGFDNGAYYRLDPDDPTEYIDYTGCGNTLNMRNPYVLQLIMDSLRYWVTEMHVDGFRFDLASALARELHDVDRLSVFFNMIQQDPVISRVKLIAEPWDIGEGGYQVGAFPPLWSEWNGRYRDSVRDFWRGHSTRGELAERLCGSSDLYDHRGRSPHASVNFITAHDGFTLADLVSFETKRNAANGEDNRDGSDDNRSWNCGIEGPTDDEFVLAVRARQRRNLLTTLFISQGVPMLLAGDELGRSQGGMNNAYAQNNEISWVDWDHIDTEQVEFTRRLTSFRAAHPVLRRRRFFEGRPQGRSPRHDVTWFAPDATLMTDARWEDPTETVLVGVLNGHAITEPDRHGLRIVDDSLMIVVNGADDQVDVVLPSGDWPSTWTVSIDTYHPVAVPVTIHRAADLLTVPSRTVVVLTASAD